MADKKLLILYASAGHGHEKAAKAVAETCRKRGFSRVDCVDMLAYSSFGFGARYRGLYLFLIRMMPWLWGFAYYAADVPFIYWFLRPLRRLNNHFFVPGVEKLILESSADIIISTHFMGCEVSATLKKKKRINAKLITVVTDYLAHTFWLETETDRYCVASDDTALDLERRGVSAERILVTGIPIESKFFTAPARETVRNAMSLSKSLFTLLLTSGGAGGALLESLVDSLAIQEPPFQLLVVCGTNEKMRLRLQARHRERTNIHLYGFVDNIHELMSAADLIVGKGGGLTITESLAMARPMVLVGAVPGQETRNVRVMVRKGAASRADSFLQVKIQISKYRDDAPFYAKTLGVIEATRRPNAAESVLNAALGACA